MVFVRKMRLRAGANVLHCHFNMALQFADTFHVEMNAPQEQTALAATC
jgi:hypothetical protein